MTIVRNTSIHVSRIRDNRPLSVNALTFVLCIKWLQSFIALSSCMHIKALKTSYEWFNYYLDNTVICSNNESVPTEHTDVQGHVHVPWYHHMYHGYSSFVAKNKLYAKKIILCLSYLQQHLEEQEMTSPGMTSESVYGIVAWVSTCWCTTLLHLSQNGKCVSIVYCVHYNNNHTRLQQ